MTTPIRLTLSRKKGFDLQALSRATNGLECVVVTRASKHWGNPFRIGGWFKLGDPAGWDKKPLLWCESIQPGRAGFTLIETPALAVDFYRRLVAKHPPANLGKLRGKNLACTCKSSPCHADVLIELANR